MRQPSKMSTANAVETAIERSKRDEKLTWAELVADKQTFRNDHPVRPAYTENPMPISIPTNFRLTPECIDLMEQLEVHYTNTLNLPRVTKGKVIEILVRAKAKELGLRVHKGR